jgi:hypothetical protein
MKSEEATTSRLGLEAGIDTFVLDLGGLLIDWNPHRRVLGEDVNGMERFVADVCTPWEEMLGGPH